MLLRVTIEVEYARESGDPDEAAMRQQLASAVHHLASEGLLTGDGDHTVERLGTGCDRICSEHRLPLRDGVCAACGQPSTA